MALTTVSLSMTEAGPEPDHTGLKWGLGLGLGLLVLVGVGIVIYCCCKNYRTAGRNGKYNQQLILYC